MVTQSSGKKYHGTLTKKLFRDMSRSAMQFLAMFLLCAMGTWCFSGLDANWRMLELSTETPIAQSNLADFWVKGASCGKNDRLKLRALMVGEKDSMVYLASEQASIELVCPDVENVRSIEGGVPFVVQLDEVARAKQNAAAENEPDIHQQTRITRKEA